MPRLIEHSLLKNHISKLFIDLENEINEEKKSYLGKEQKWSISKLDPDFSIEKPKNEIIEFQIGHGIKFQQNNSIYWNQEYIKEALNYLYLEEVIPFVEEQCFILKSNIYKVFDTSNISRIIDYIEEKIIEFHSYTEREYGRWYYDLNYQHNHNFEHRFEVIWFYNERNRFKSNSLDKESSVVNFENPSVPFFDYPFLSIKIQEWINFETTYRLVPILKGCLDFFNRHREYLKRHSPKFNIDYIIQQNNRFDELFRTAKDCEFFFYYIEKYGVEKKVDWTYIYEIFDNDRRFKNKRTQIKNYRDLVKKVYGVTIPSIRHDPSNKVYEVKLGSLKNKIDNFDNLIKHHKYKG